MHDDLPSMGPLSPAQQRLWVLDQLSPGSAAYTVPVVYRLVGRFDRDALVGAIEDVVARQPALSTRVVVEQGRARQRVVPGLVAVGVEERASGESVADAVERVLAEEAGRVFDLEAGPLFVPRVVRLAPEDHLLVLTTHHIVSDGWSVGLVLAELTEAYRLRTTGGADDRSTPLSFVDVAARHQRWQTGDVAEQQRKYWRTTLSGANPVLDLPVDHPAPAVWDGSGDHVEHEFAAGPVAALARDRGATLFMVLLAGVQALLGKLTGEEDFLLGTVTSGRTDEDTDDVVGFFTNTVPLRVDLTGDPTTGDLVDRARDQVLDAFDHQELAFGEIVDLVRPERSAGHTPLVQAVVSMTEQRGAELAIPGVRVRELPVPQSSAKFDLQFDFVEDGDVVRLELAYRTALFDRASVRRVVDHLGLVLTEMAADPTRRVSELALVLPGETRLLGAVEAPSSADTLPGLVTARARATPDAVAVEYDGTRLTYAELVARANQLASRLTAAGVGPETRVAVCLERSAELVPALLGVLTAGAAYVPLDPAYPAPRLAFLAEDAGVAVVVTTAELTGTVPSVAADVLVLDEVWAGPAAEAPPVGLSPDNAAYVIHTSGSTGTPKGVVVTHRNVVNLVLGTAADYRLGADDVWTMFHSFAFDFSVWEIWGALVHGARVVVVPSWMTRSAPDFLALLRSRRVTVLNQTPSAFRALVAARHAEGGGDPLAVRLVVFGGEALDADLVARWRELDDTARLVNMYGITETTVHTTWHPVEPGARFSAGASVIGTPIPGVFACVLDRWGGAVPAGVVGELFVGGAGVSRGYLGRGGLTASRFVPDFVSGVPGGRLYRTGDRVRWRLSGELEFVGRVDDQVKVRGFRVELGEVESVVGACPGVAGAVVSVVDSGAGARLIAYVVPDAGPEPAQTRLRAFVAERLPAHLVPSVFVVVAELPVGPTGKVDRRALPAPDTHRPDVGGYRAPADGAERALAEVWADVLGLERVGADDNFFALGGDSILSIQVVARAATAGIRVTPRQLFQHQTVAGLAGVATTGRVEAEQGPVTGVVPLTPVQRWFLTPDVVDPHHYNQSVLLDVDGRVTPEVVEQVLTAVLAHHDGLRSRFVQDSGGWRRVIDPPGAPVHVVRAEGDAQTAADAVQSGFDLAAGPLVAALWLPDPSRLLLVVHHLVVDTVSWRILLEDLERGCAQVLDGRPVDLGPKTTSVRDWALRLREHARSDAVLAELPQWQDVAPVGDLPVDGPGGLGLAESTDVVTASVPATVAADLVRLPGVRVEDLLLTALARVLCAWSGQHRVAVDLEGHGREDLFADVDLSRTVGWFTTIFPATLAVDPRLSLLESLDAVRDQVRALPHRGIGFGLLRWATDDGDDDVARSIAERPVPQVSFNYLGRFDTAGSTGLFRPLPDSCGRESSPKQVRRHLFEINGGLHDDGLHLDWAFDADRHDRATVVRLAALLEAEIVALVDAAAAPAPRRAVAAGVPADFAHLDDVEDVYPLTPLQEGLLFHSSYSPDAALYVVQPCYRIEGDLDADRLRAAWAAVIDHHPVLRTVFAQRSSGTPLQLVRRTVAPEWTVEDWRGDDDPDRRLAEFLAEDRARGIDVAAAPLLRFHLARVEDGGYWLVWTHHHAILDGWSVPLVLRDVATAYAALGRGERVSLPASTPFRDHVRWLRDQDTGAADVYWRAQLTGVSAPTPLGVPTPIDGHGHGHVVRRLDAQATAALDRFVRQHQLTLSSVVQGAWSLLLARYSGQDDVVFGVTSAGRSTATRGIESVVGPLINTLPARVRLDPAATVLDWLGELQLAQADRQAVEHTSLRRAQRFANLSGTADLFASIVIVTNQPDTAVVDQGLEFTPIAGVETTNYPITLGVSPGETVSVHLTHDRAQVGDADAARMADLFTHLLTVLAHHPGTRLDRVPTLPPGEPALLGTPPETGAGEGLVHELVFAKARETPDAVAVELGDERLSYAELVTRSRALAVRLRAAGVGPECRVGVHLDRSADVVVALLAVLAAGGAYVPMDPDFPRDRLVFMADDAQVTTIVTTTVLADALGVDQSGVVLLDEPWTATGELPAVRLSPDNAAYLIYTSGSTGTPKGAVVTHRNLVNHMRWMVRFFGIGADARVLHRSAFSFDGSVWEFWLPLLTGGTLVLLEPQRQADVAHLVDVIERHRITTVQMGPHLLSLFLDQELGDRVSGLRNVFSGGEQLGADLPARVTRLGARLHNLYGPTEVTMNASAWTTRADEPPPVPIGVPVDNTFSVVLDRWGGVVPVGVVGELFVGGAGVSRGYLGRGGLTGSRFVPDFVSGVPGGRLYRTGDRVRWRSSGELEFVGRVDDQVKLRGFRVELGEVESVVRACQGVAGAVASVVDGGQRARLIAWVVPAAGVVLDPEALRRQAAARLPQFMVPSAFVVVAELPVGPTGKVDRRALPAPDATHPAVGAGRAPAAGVERSLADIWAEVLGVGRVGADDNFFALGGDSILSIQVVARAATAGIRVTPRQLFQHQTVAELAAVAAEGRVAATQGPVTGPVALTPIQRSFLASDVVDPHHYNQSVLLDVADRVTPEVVAEVLDAIVAHHDGLRSRFVQDGGRWQRVIDPPGTPVRLIRAEGDEQAAADAVQAGFDLAAGPLVAALWLSDPSRLLVVAHHLVVDTVSWRILLEDLERGCAQVLDGRPVDLGPKTTSVRDWALRLREHARSDAVLAELPHWSAEDHPATELPVDHPDGEALGDAAVVSVRVPVAGLADLAGASVEDVLLTALARVLCAWSGQHRVGVDLEGHGREDLFADVDLSRTVGWFTTAFPVTLEVDRDASRTESLELTTARLRSVPRRGIGFGLLRWAADDGDYGDYGDDDVARSIAERPGPQVGFNYLGRFDTPRSGGLFQPLPGTLGAESAPQAGRHLFELDCGLHDDGLRLDWTFHPARHTGRP